MKFRLIVDKEKDEEVVVVTHSANNFTAKIENLVLSYNGSDEIPVFWDDEITSLKYSSIECITIIDRKLYAIDKNANKYRINQKLCDIEERLPDYFIRINKSSIANERRILSFKAGFSGSVDAVFKCGYKDYVSRRCFSMIKRRFGI